MGLGVAEPVDQVAYLPNVETVIRDSLMAIVTRLYIDATYSSFRIIHRFLTVLRCLTDSPSLLSSFTSILLILSTQLIMHPTGQASIKVFILDWDVP